jgi:hypothetical protein
MAPNRFLLNILFTLHFTFFALSISRSLPQLYRRPKGCPRRNGNSNAVSALDSFSRAAFQIDGKIALGLALQAGVAQRNGPDLIGAVVFQPAILHRLMLAFTDVVENDSGFLIASHGKANTIREAGLRHVSAAARVTNVAEVTQFGLSGSDLFAVGAAGPAEAGTQGQAGRERPCYGAILFTGIKIRAGHNGR